MQTTRHSKQKAAGATDQQKRKPASATDRCSATIAQGDGQGKPTTEGVRETRDIGGSAREKEEDVALERSEHFFFERGNNVYKWEGVGSSSLYDLRDRFASHDDEREKFLQH